MRDELKAKNVELVKDLTEHLPNMHCDSQQLKQVFLNLFTNALQAMQEGGTLTIATYLVTEGEAPYVTISVTDTGGGIPEKSLPNIFNPFFTTKDTGTGLGLSITHRIVAHHHGEIEVIITNQARRNRRIGGDMKRILVVDDEENIRMLYQEELQEEGYEVTVASNGTEALEALSKAPFDLVTLDIRMPGMDGINTVRAIKEKYRDLAVVLVTAYGEYKQDFSTWASDAYIVKSADLTELKATIKGIIG